MPDASPTAPQSANEPVAQPGDRQLQASLMRLHEARARGDRATAVATWNAIVAAELERVRGLVRGFRHPALPAGRIPADTIDDTVANVFMRLHGKSDALHGRSVGELRAFLRTAAGFQCQDFLKAHVKDDQRRAGSIDATGPGGAPTATDHGLARLAERLGSDSVEGDIARETVHAGLALVDDDKRGVLVMLHLGHSTEEVMERFGLSRDNVYQRRRRGLVQLRAAIEELDREDEDA